MTSDTGAPSPPDTDGGLDALLVVAIEVVVAVAVWGLIGLIIDLVAGTGPWVQFVGILVGTAIGLVLARRRATPLSAAGNAHG